MHFGVAVVEFLFHNQALAQLVTSQCFDDLRLVLVCPYPLIVLRQNTSFNFVNFAAKDKTLQYDDVTK